MAATATPTKPRKAPTLFSVKGNADGITTALSEYASKQLLHAVIVLQKLALSEGTFPKASALADALVRFEHDPTAKPGESK